MTHGKHFAAGGDHFAALPNKKIHTPKGIARLTVTAATMAAMTGSSLISPFTAFTQTGDGGQQAAPAPPPRRRGIRYRREIRRTDHRGPAEGSRRGEGEGGRRQGILQ